MKNEFHLKARLARRLYGYNRQRHYGVLFGVLLFLCCLGRDVTAQNNNDISPTDMVGSGLIPEACCLGDTCEMLDPQACMNAGGTPMGPGTQCASREACCFRGGSCQNMDPLCCVFQATGTPLGAGTGCLGDNNNDDKDDACAPPQFSCDSVRVYNSLMSNLPCTQGISLQYNNNPSLIYNFWESSPSARGVRPRSTSIRRRWSF